MFANNLLKSQVFVMAGGDGIASDFLNTIERKIPKERLVELLEKEEIRSEDIFTRQESELEAFSVWGYSENDRNLQKYPVEKGDNISLLENLGVVVCPYCNRDYINSRGNSFGANFDHFFDKDDFPFFALSLYNLIPSCATCNRIKGNDSIDFCPFDTASEANFHFEVAPRSKVKIRCSNQGSNGSQMNLP